MCPAFRLTNAGDIMKILLRLIILSSLALGACGDDGGRTDPPDTGGESDTGTTTRCGGGDDLDSDTISNEDEGEGDFDEDGTPNSEDTDSDGDSILDSVEAGDASCLTPPVDTDGDGSPDFLDLDSNGDGIPDRDQIDVDTDGDGIPDGRDPDIDGDGIPNVDEYDEMGNPVDSDGDGMPDHLDLDSDNDTITDAQEGSRDPDADGIPNFRDTDSDDDGIEDSVEAGDGDTMTAPESCPEELDPFGNPGSDGLPDFADRDSDGDGADDGLELEFGTDPCNPDSDGDGFGDLVEIAREQTNCVDGEGEGCGCATIPACGIPPEDYFIVLPYMGEPVERDLDFATDIRTADVFFITDTTGSMGSTVTNVKATVGTPGTGLIARISEVIPDAWFGGGQHDDFPFGGYGSGPDEPFILAIRMTPPERSEDVRIAFDGIELHGGSDGPESQSEALFQIMNGAGETWTYSGGFGGGSTYTIRRYVGDCLDGGYGAPCFREGALPIIVHFTDICAHNGPPGDEGSCSTYTGITPEPASWADAVAAMNVRGAKYIGINASRTSCSGVVGPSGSRPCHFLQSTAEETGSIDLDGNLLVFDLPNGSTSTAFADQVVNAVETVATRVPIDVDTALRDDATDAEDVDATRFIKRRQPACRATPPTDPCWTPPAGIEPEAAVAAVDESTFFGAIPGTSVKFRITFRNDFLPGARTSRIYIAYIDVRGSGAAVLDTRQVFIVVPAQSMGPG